MEVPQKRASRLPVLQDALGNKVSHSQSMVGFHGDVNSKVLQDFDKTETGTNTARFLLCQFCNLDIPVFFAMK